MTLNPEELVRIIGHMNQDHVDSLVLYAHTFANRQDVDTAKMIDLTENDIVLELTSGEQLTIPLTRSVKTAKDAHQILVAMSKQARSQLEE